MKQTVLMSMNLIPFHVKFALHNFMYYQKYINSTDEHEFDPIPCEVRTPQFYVLPKIHKQYQETLPVGYPGCPIVSACNSYTENISKYLDYILQPYMKTLPSYVKDTTDFICKIKSVPNLSKNSLLITLDVTSLILIYEHSPWRWYKSL